MRAGAERIVFALPLAFLAAFLMAPVAYLFVGAASSLGLAPSYIYVKLPPEGELFKVYSVGGYKIIALTGYDFGPLANTIILAGVVSLSSTALSLMTSLAVLSMRRGRLVLGYILPAVAAVPAPLLSAYAVIHLFHRDFGIVNAVLGGLLGYRVSLEGIAGVAVYQVLHIIPITHLIILAYLETIDRALIESAENLGVRGVRLVTGVVVPLARPAILVSLALAFVISAEDLAGPIAFSRYNSARNLLSYIAYFDFISEYGYTVTPRSVAYTSILVALAVTVFALSWRGLRRHSYPVASPAGVVLDLGRQSLALKLLAALVIVLSASVTGLALSYSVTRGWFGSPVPEGLTLSNYLEALSNGYYLRAAVNTLVYTTASVALAMLLGYLSSYASARMSGALAPFMEAATVIPLVIPGIAVGIGYFFLFHRVAGWLGPLDPLANPAPYLVMAYTARRITYMTRPVTASLTKIPVSLEEAARNLGASTFRVMGGICLPLTANSLAVASVLTSLNIATEFSASVVLAGGVDISEGHPAPVTPVILNSLLYNPLSIHVMSSLLVVSVAASVASTLILVALVRKALARLL